MDSTTLLTGLVAYAQTISREEAVKNLKEATQKYEQVAMNKFASEQDKEETFQALSVHALIIQIKSIKVPSIEMIEDILKVSRIMDLTKPNNQCQN